MSRKIKIEFLSKDFVHGCEFQKREVGLQSRSRFYAYLKRRGHSRLKRYRFYVHSSSKEHCISMPLHNTKEHISPIPSLNAYAKIQVSYPTIPIIQSVPSVRSSSQLNLFSAGCGTCTKSSPSSLRLLPHGSSNSCRCVSRMLSSRRVRGSLSSLGSDGREEGL